MQYGCREHEGQVSYNAPAPRASPRCCSNAKSCLFSTEALSASRASVTAAVVDQEDITVHLLVLETNFAKIKPLYTERDRENMTVNMTFEREKTGIFLQGSCSRADVSCLRYCVY